MPSLPIRIDEAVMPTPQGRQLHIQRTYPCIRNHEHNIVFIYTGWNEQKNTRNLGQQFGIQTNFRPVQTFFTLEGGTHNSLTRKNLANSCSCISLQMMLFTPLEFTEQVSKVGILARNLVWVVCMVLAQVWTVLPPHVLRKLPRSWSEFAPERV